MGILAADSLRVQKPFLVTGVDFCAPFLTSYRIRGKTPYKTYIAVFICFSSKAVDKQFSIVSQKIFWKERNTAKIVLRQCDYFCWISQQT